MPGLGCSDGERNRLQVAHFANHDHVWIFPQRSAQSSGERFCMREYFALRNMAVFRLDDVLDWVLQGNDVIAPLSIYLLDHRRERRRFASADRTRRQDQAVLIT